MNKYELMLVDLSFILSRNLYIISKERKDYTVGRVMKSVIQTISGIFTNYGITADKVILISDKWSPEYSGYYRTHLIKDLIDYKGDREHITYDYIDSVSSGISSEELERLKEKAYLEDIRHKSREAIMADFKNIGLPVYYVDSWEADDIAYLSTNLLYDLSDKKSILVTNDSDWKYLISPKMDYFSFPKKGESPKTLTYDEMYDSIPEDIKNKGVSLYDYSAYLNSLGVSHNNMKSTKKPRANNTKTILGILNNDYTNVIDINGFKIQFDTFDLKKFPHFEEARAGVNMFNSFGHLGNLDDFHNICEKYGIYGITDDYFQNLMNYLNPNLYKE